jgi:hypothetical protein
MTRYKNFEHGLAAERWDSNYLTDVTTWLSSVYGPSNESTGRWHLRQYYVLKEHKNSPIDLYMDTDVYMMFLLRWT